MTRERGAGTRPSLQGRWSSVTTFIETLVSRVTLHHRRHSHHLTEPWEYFLHLFLIFLRNSAPLPWLQLSVLRGAPAQASHASRGRASSHCRTHPPPRDCTAALLSCAEERCFAVAARSSAGVLRFGVILGYVVCGLLASGRAVGVGSPISANVINFGVFVCAATV